MCYALFYIALLIFNTNIDISDNIFTLNISKEDSVTPESLEVENNKALTYYDYISQVK